MREETQTLNTAAQFGRGVTLKGYSGAVRAAILFIDIDIDIGIDIDIDIDIDSDIDIDAHLCMHVCSYIQLLKFLGNYCMFVVGRFGHIILEGVFAKNTQTPK